MRRRFDFYLCWNLLVVLGLVTFFYYFLSGL